MKVGKGVNQTLTVKDHNSLKKTDTSPAAGYFATHTSLTFLKLKKKKSRPKSQILEGEKKGHLDVLGCLFFFNLLLYEPNFTEQIKPILIVTGCGATKRSSVHSSGPHFIQDM